MVQHTDVEIQSPSAYITNGMALVQKLKVDYLSFGEIADIALRFQEGFVRQKFPKIVVFFNWEECNIIFDIC